MVQLCGYSTITIGAPVTDYHRSPVFSVDGGCLKQWPELPPRQVAENIGVSVSTTVHAKYLQKPDTKNL